MSEIGKPGGAKDTGATIKNEEKDALLEEYNRNILKGFYSVFKKSDADLRFVLLTGVTKFSQSRNATSSTPSIC